MSQLAPDQPATTRSFESRYIAAIVIPGVVAIVAVVLIWTYRGAIAKWLKRYWDTGLRGVDHQTQMVLYTGGAGHDTRVEPFVGGADHETGMAPCAGAVREARMLAEA